MTTRSADRVLIANRGEIALRVVRTVRDLGGTSILPYTPEDLLSPAAELADEAHALPEGSSYTDTAAILDLARRTGADAIHPGYGFLSEHADFARAVMDAGITWVGPSPEAMEALGDKMSARATAERAGVAPVPGITTPRAFGDSGGPRERGAHAHPPPRRAHAATTRPPHFVRIPQLGPGCIAP